MSEFTIRPGAAPVETVATGANPAAACGERRGQADRRKTLLSALLYGGLRPRRRAGRRTADLLRPIVDWHDPLLLISAFGLLVLCACDAALTLALMTNGAREANPVMDLFVGGDLTRFALVKFALTAGGLLIMVAVARFTVFRSFRVARLVHLAAAGYMVLIAYEVWLVDFMTP